MSRVRVAAHAGFCFGVRRATELIEERLKRADGERIYTLGRLIHNDTYNARLDAAGVVAIEAEDILSVVFHAVSGARPSFSSLPEFPT